MFWNHRVFRSTDETHGEVSYTIREVFYDEDGTIEGWTTDAIEPYSEDLEGLRLVLQQMLEACDRPVLDEQVVGAALTVKKQQRSG